MPAPSAPANLYTTHMTQNLSMLSLILNATLLAQAVMLLLLLFSMASWTLIFKKGAIIRTARAQTERFEHHFWSGGDLQTLYHLATLASIGSVSPYIGLFGTVWGIMNSFRGLSNVQQATLANVAPGIAEAL